MEREEERCIERYVSDRDGAISRGIIFFETMWTGSDNKKNDIGFYSSTYDHNGQKQKGKTWKSPFLINIWHYIRQDAPQKKSFDNREYPFYGIEPRRESRNIKKVYTLFLTIILINFRMMKRYILKK